MGGQAFELLGLVALSGVAGVFSIVLGTAGVQAHGQSALVGLLFIGSALVLLLTAVSVGVWGIHEWIRADGTRATVAALPDRDSEGRLRTISAAMKQGAFIQISCKVAFFCCAINLVVELIFLRRCKRIFLLSTPPDHHYCDNLSYKPTGFSSINPPSRTWLSELPGTVRRLLCTRSSRALCSAHLLLLRSGVGYRFLQHDFFVRRNPAGDPGPEGALCMHWWYAAHAYITSLLLRPAYTCPSLVAIVRPCSPAVSCTGCRCSALSSVGGPD
jgi:hypothetical protein